jgi:RimJ/RimL family protein N-acetyltransferase
MAEALDVTLAIAEPRHQEQLLRYLGHKIGIPPAALVGDMPFRIIATVRGDRLMGAMLFTNYRGASIEMSLAGEPGWFTRRGLREYFSYPFETLRVRRVTSIIHRRNKESRALAARLGFKLEGVARDGFPDGDAMIYGLTRKDCKWI